jgi:hypothetical protein
MHTLRPRDRFAGLIDWAALRTVGASWVNIQGERTCNISLRNRRIDDLAAHYTQHLAGWAI